MPARRRHRRRCTSDVDTFNAKLQKQGSWVFAGGLHPANTATVVRVQNGEVLTSDGPFAESKEQLGGFWVVNAPDLDAALKLWPPKVRSPAAHRSRFVRSKTSRRAERV